MVTNTMAANSRSTRRGPKNREAVAADTPAVVEAIHTVDGKPDPVTEIIPAASRIYSRPVFYSGRSMRRRCLADRRNGVATNFKPWKHHEQRKIDRRPAAS